MQNNKKIYLNLTNGIEALNIYPSLPRFQYGFIRIQSTACEQKRWNNILLDLDYDFLFNLAIGTTCFIYDFGARKTTPRAVYQGVEFVKYVLNRYWYNLNEKVYVKRGKTPINVTDYFDEEYKKLDKHVFKKLDYFKPYLFDNKVNIIAVTNKTTHDGEKSYYSDIIKKALLFN